jgi:hypothetical protein
MLETEDIMSSVSFLSLQAKRTHLYMSCMLKLEKRNGAKNIDKLCALRRKDFISDKI